MTEKDNFSKNKKQNKKKAEQMQEGRNSQNTSAGNQQEEQQKQSEEQQEDLQKQVEELQAQLAEAKDQYVRLAAEFDNFRRRTAKERLDLIGSAGKDVLLGILPVVDDCQRALTVLKESDASQAAVEGTELICNKLLAFLKSRGMTPIEAKGQEFNTDFHEAVAQFPVQDEALKNKIIDVTQEGYMLNGSVARFAKVVVGI